MKLKRRLISPIFAILTVIAVVVPPHFGWISDRRANEIVLSALAFTFAALSVLTWWKRRLMIYNAQGHRRELTLFGTALVDEYAAKFILFLASLALYGFWASTSVGWTTFTINSIAVLRGCLIAGCVLVLGTGFGVAWEIRRARNGVAVHIPAEPSDVVLYEGPDRRKTSRGRRLTDQ